jgi:hypothetical protein
VRFPWLFLEYVGGPQDGLPALWQGLQGSQDTLVVLAVHDSFEVVIRVGSAVHGFRSDGLFPRVPLPPPCGRRADSCMQVTGEILRWPESVPERTERFSESLMQDVLGVMLTPGQDPGKRQSIGPVHPIQRSGGFNVT